MTKDLLIKKYADKYGVTQKQAETDLNRFGDFMVECVANEGVFRLAQVVEIKKVADTRTEVNNPRNNTRVPNSKSFKIKTKALKKILDLRG